MSSFPKPHHAEISIEDMEIFELIARVIKRGEAGRFAKLYGCSEQTVRKWRCDPEADDYNPADPHGRRSPLDNILQLLDVINAIDPDRFDDVWNRLEYEVAKMQSAHGKEDRMRKWRSLKKVNALAREIVAATETDAKKDDG